MVEFVERVRLADAAGAGGQEEDFAAVGDGALRQLQGPLGDVEVDVVGQAAGRDNQAVGRLDGVGVVAIDEVEGVGGGLRRRAKGGELDPARAELTVVRANTGRSPTMRVMASSWSAASGLPRRAGLRCQGCTP